MLGEEGKFSGNRCACLVVQLGKNSVGIKPKSLGKNCLIMSVATAGPGGFSVAGHFGCLFQSVVFMVFIGVFDVHNLCAVESARY